MPFRGVDLCKESLKTKAGGFIWGTCTAGCERHAVLVLLIGVQHAQGHRQLPSAVRYDGKGQLAAPALFAVVRQDVLVSIQMFKPQYIQSVLTPAGLHNSQRLYI